MTLAQQYEKFTDACMMNPCEATWDQLEEFERKNKISHGWFEGCGWSCCTIVFKDASIYGWSGLYQQHFDFFTAFQQ
mgnify:CR=1 FL=1